MPGALMTNFTVSTLTWVIDALIDPHIILYVFYTYRRNCAYSGLSTAAKALGVAYHHEQSVKSCFAILVQFGEDLPRVMGDGTLRADIDKMNYILQSTSDDMIYSMQGNSDKKMATLVNLYANLAHVVHYFQPWLVGSVSLRMVAVTIKTGLSAKSPLAFAHFGGVLSSIGYVNEGCRLGELHKRESVLTDVSLYFFSHETYFAKLL